MMQSLIDLNYAVESKLIERKRKVFEVWLSLTRTQFALVQREKEDITDKQSELQFVLGLLSKSLKDYFSCQESVLSSFLDESLIQTMVIEHREIIEQVDTIKDAVARLRRLNKRQSSTRIADVQKSITDIRRRVEEDTIKEEMLFQLLRAEGHKHKEKLSIET